MGENTLIEYFILNTFGTIKVMHVSKQFYTLQKEALKMGFFFIL